MGADGVVHAVPDDASGQELETVILDLGAFGDMRVFSVRDGGAIPSDAGRVRLDVPAGTALPLALLPYDAPQLTVDVARDPDWLQVRIAMDGEGPFVSHVLRVDVLDRDGTPDIP